AREVLERRRDQVVVLAHAADRRVRVAARQDGVLDEAHASTSGWATTPTRRASAVVTSCAGPVIAMIVRGGATPGITRRWISLWLVIAPPVVSCALASAADASACEPTHTSTSPGSTTRTMR